MKLYWLIEAPNPKGADAPRGYIEEIDTCDTFDVYMTIDPNKAMKFSSQYAAQCMLDNPAFIHAMGTDRGFVVAEHGFDCGIAPEVPLARPVLTKGE